MFRAAQRELPAVAAIVPDATPLPVVRKGTDARTALLQYRSWGILNQRKLEQAGFNYGCVRRQYMAGRPFTDCAKS